MKNDQNLMILTTLQDPHLLASLSGPNRTIVPLVLDAGLNDALEALDGALEVSPPTSIGKAHGTWMPLASALGSMLLSQMTRAGLPDNWSTILARFPRIFVATERIVPVDLIPCGTTLLGTEAIVAHVVAPETRAVHSILCRSLKPRRRLLRRIAHVSTYEPGTTSLYDMDVIAATLRIRNDIAIEHYLFPSLGTSQGLFRRTDIDILHYECHGTTTLLQIDNPWGEPQDVRTFYEDDGPRVYFFLGCEAGSQVAGTSASFVGRGAEATLGAYCRFASGGDSGEVCTTLFYDELYGGLLNRRSLGESLRAGRKAAAPERIYYCAWLLFGNPGISFDIVPYGAGIDTGGHWCSR